MIFSNELLREIGNNTFIGEVVDLSCQEIDDHGVHSLVDALKKNVHIKSVILRDNQISDKGAVELATVAALQCLDISENSLTCEGAKALSTSLLKKLNVSYNAIKDTGLITFSQNKFLLELKATNCEITDKGAAELFASNNVLKKIDLSCNNIGNTGMTSLALNQSLIELDLSTNQITAEGAVLIAQNKTLKTLSLADNKINLNITKNKVNDEGIRALAKHVALETVNLTQCGINSDVGDFGNSKTLRALILFGNQINSAAIKGLSKSSTLNFLNLSYNELDNECIPDLVACKSLRELLISHNPISDDAIALLLKLLAKNAGSMLERVFLPTHTLKQKLENKEQTELVSSATVPSIRK
jgi:Leucine-rich repeat (LRR) protein